MKASIRGAAPLLLTLLLANLAAAEPRKDLEGMLLPDGVVARMGSGRLRQPEVIGHLAFSRDGKMLITASGFPDGTVRAWDAKSAKLLWRVAIPFKGVHSYYVEVTATDMGTLVVLTGDRRGETRPVARTLSLANGKELKKTELKLPADAASNPVLSPDGNSMAVATDNGTLRLYDVNHGQETLRIAIPQTQTGIQCTWSPDSKRVAVTSVDGPSILVHDAKTGKQIAAVKQDASYVPYLDFSADGRLLVCAAANYEKESPLTVWNLETGRALYRQRNEAWSAVRFLPNGKHLAIADRSNLKLVEATTGKFVRAFPVSSAYALDFSLEGHTLAVGHGNSFSQWDVGTGRPLEASANPRMNVDKLRFDKLGKRLLGRAENFIAWDPATGKEVQRFANDHEHLRGRLELSRDESLFVGPDPTGKKVLMWSATTAKMLGSIEPEGGVLFTMLTPDARRLVTWGEQMLVWDVETRQVLHSLSANREKGWPRAMSSDSRWLVSATIEPRGAPSIVRLWDLGTGREVRQFTAPPGYACAVALSPDGRRLAAFANSDRESDAGSFKLWDAATGRELLSWSGDVGHVRSLSFSPDGRMLASGGCQNDNLKGRLYLWETASGRQRRAFDGHEHLVDSVAFSPKGDLLAASSGDAPVYVWDIWAGLPTGGKLSAAELERAWKDLAGEDAALAFGAIRLLSTAPEQAPPFLRERLRRVAPADAEQVRRLVGDLDSKRFNERQKAAAELERLGDAAAHILEDVLPKASSVELRRRLQMLLARLELVTPEATRTVRAVEVLEWIRTSDAQRLLDDLARGAPAALLTREAIKARDRLGRAP